MMQKMYLIFSMYYYNACTTGETAISHDKNYWAHMPHKNLPCYVRVCCMLSTLALIYKERTEDN